VAEVLLLRVSIGRGFVCEEEGVQVCRDPSGRPRPVHPYRRDHRLRGRLQWIVASHSS
jgi:hypothetical protein